jgi:hypothetical protein
MSILIEVFYVSRRDFFGELVGTRLPEDYLEKQPFVAGIRHEPLAAGTRNCPAIVELSDTQRISICVIC